MMNGAEMPHMGGQGGRVLVTGKKRVESVFHNFGFKVNKDWLLPYLVRFQILPQSVLYDI